jgi:alanine dehydrogenase
VPPHVKGIEGVPHGSLDQYVFGVDDPIYERMDARIGTRFRRTALSCYSWPGVEPLDCMEVYSHQIAPVLEMLLHRPIDDWDVASGHYIERAVARAELGRWNQEHRR